MEKNLYIDASHPNETRVVLKSESNIEDYEYEGLKNNLIKNNIYLGKVSRIEPSLQAAFVDFGRDRHGFLSFNDIQSDYYQIPKSDLEIIKKQEELAREELSKKVAAKEEKNLAEGKLEIDDPLEVEKDEGNKDINELSEYNLEIDSSGDNNQEEKTNEISKDVTDKNNPTYVDSWYDADHPSGPHNLYPHMIDGEWYIFVANPDYEQCDSALGEACGGVTIAHLNLQGSAARTLPGIPGSGQGHTIIKVGEYEVAWETTRGGWIYIHDMTVQKWPGEDQEDPRYGRTFIYGSYWEAGLRIGDVTDVPHPVNSPESYTLMATACKLGQGNPVMCRWRAPEVGSWMDFLDLDDDGQPDSGTTGNENGGRVSYIHYAEPFPTMLDVSHKDERFLELASRSR